MDKPSIWISWQPANQSGLTCSFAYAEQFQQWLQPTFKPALQCVQLQGLAVETPLLSLVHNGLSHLVSADTKRDFACGLMRGLGANLDEAGRLKLTAEISKLTGEPTTAFSTNASDLAVMLRCFSPNFW